MVSVNVSDSLDFFMEDDGIGCVLGDFSGSGVFSTTGWCPEDGRFMNCCCIYF